MLSEKCGKCYAVLRLLYKPGSGSTPLIPALGRLGKMDLYGFQASLVYKGSTRTARDKDSFIKTKPHDSSVWSDL